MVESVFRRKLRRLFAIAFVGFLHLSNAASSEDVKPTTGQSYLPINSGFEGAMLGAHAGTTNVPKSEVTRLARFGLEESKGALAPILENYALPESIDANGPLGQFLSELTPEFFAGTLFAQAAENTNKFVEDKYPFDGLSDFDTIMSLRASAAIEEFRYRNCGLIGK